MSKYRRTHIDFIKEISVIHPELIVLETFKGVDYNILVKDNFGICRVTGYSLLKGVKPSIQTAIDKNDYLLNQYNYSNNSQNKIDIIDLYTNAHTYIRVKTKYGICNVITHNIQKGITPTVKSAIDKINFTKNQFKEIHENLYDYSLFTQYINSRQKIQIRCNRCNKINSQSISSHLSGQGCKNCNNKPSIEKIEQSCNNYLKRAKIFHNNFYTYENVKYVNSWTNINITCPIHGDFLQTPLNHSSGGYCPKCLSAKSSKFYSKGTEKFITEGTTKFSSKFNYDLVEYINQDSIIKIKCPIHNIFETTGKLHLKSKHGCSKCAVDKIIEHNLENLGGWSYSTWEQQGLKSKNFNSFKLYIIKCFNDTEEFYKIGKTFVTVTERFKTKTMLPYNYEIVQEVKENPKFISNLEKFLQKAHKTYKYNPKIKFSGMHECFSEIDLELINKISENICKV